MMRMPLRTSEMMLMRSSLIFNIWSCASLVHTRTHAHTCIYIFASDDQLFTVNHISRVTHDMYLAARPPNGIDSNITKMPPSDDRPSKINLQAKRSDWMDVSDGKGGTNGEEDKHTQTVKQTDRKTHTERGKLIDR